MNRKCQCPRLGPHPWPDWLTRRRVQGLRRRALLVSGMGFFTDAYDLFVIGIVSTLLKTQWHLGHRPARVAQGGHARGGVPRRAGVRPGRRHDRPDPGVLDVGRGDGDRGGRVGAGPVAGRADRVPVPARLRGGRRLPGQRRADERVRRPPATAAGWSGWSSPPRRSAWWSARWLRSPCWAAASARRATWRILLGLGAIPAAAAVWLRRKMPEPPRFQAGAGQRGAGPAPGRG